MVTNSEKIKTWLKSCNLVTVEDVDTDRLEAQVESLGIYKQAQRDVTEFIDGSKIVGEYYYFLARRSAQLEAERISSHEFLTLVEDWVEEQDRLGNRPKIEGIEEVFIANGFYMIDAETDEAVYQISIGITYQKKGIK
nr:MAG TPA: Minor capsid protein from bacteriophage [Caudoviricetes sp.]